ncbi:hypothetical protein ACFO7V_18185 [Glutamicibacter bergerei]|uniref:Uncharacterized protein n=1 Tax=Glutamicibacter bergerei TaxID=256702 RepID=A0ABV9MQ09_9MICC
MTEEPTGGAILPKLWTGPGNEAPATVASIFGVLLSQHHGIAIPPRES